MIPEHVQAFALYAAVFYCLVRWGGPLFLIAALYQVWVGEWGVAVTLSFFAAFFHIVRRWTQWSTYIDFCRRPHRRRW